MNTIDIEELISDIENAVMDNGMVFDVASAEPDEVKDDVAFLDTFRMLHPNSSLINERSQWVKISYGDISAYIGIRQGDNRIEAIVDINEECPIDDLDKMITDGIRHYADRAGVDDVKIIRSTNNN